MGDTKDQRVRSLSLRVKGTAMTRSTFCLPHPPRTHDSCGSSRWMREKWERPEKWNSCDCTGPLPSALGGPFRVWIRVISHCTQCLLHLWGGLGSLGRWSRENCLSFTTSRARIGQCLLGNGLWWPRRGLLWTTNIVWSCVLASYSIEDKPQNVCMGIMTGESWVSSQTPNCPHPWNTAEVLLIKKMHFVASLHQ